MCSPAVHYQFLEVELKQSYATKNFTLKNALLELEKQYRQYIAQDPAMAALWADVTVLLVSGTASEQRGNGRLL